ncbi:MAG: 4Fe-4S binding protein [Patescibacteria group bacterium]
MKININLKSNIATQAKTGNWRIFTYPEVDHEKCIGCAMCERVCPEGIFFPTGEKNKAGKIVYEKDLDYCKGCGLCAEICPVKAIIMAKEEK